MENPETETAALTVTSSQTPEKKKPSHTRSITVTVVVTGAPEEAKELAQAAVDAAKVVAPQIFGG